MVKFLWKGPNFQKFLYDVFFFAHQWCPSSASSEIIPGYALDFRWNSAKNSQIFKWNIGIFAFEILNFLRIFCSNSPELTGTPGMHHLDLHRACTGPAHAQARLRTAVCPPCMPAHSGWWFWSEKCEKLKKNRINLINWPKCWQNAQKYKKFKIVPNYPRLC